MSSRPGRPRKQQPLYAVTDWVEYTSDSDSDSNNVHKNVHFIDQTSIQYIQHAAPSLAEANASNSHETYNHPWQASEAEQASNSPTISPQHTIPESPNYPTNLENYVHPEQAPLAESANINFNFQQVSEVIFFLNFLKNFSF